MKGGEGRRESAVLLQTLVGSTLAGWLVCPVDLALCFSHVGEVFHGFQKEGGIWACLIKGISWAPKALREGKKGSIVLERYGAEKDPCPRSCVRKRGEREKQKSLSRLWA